MHEQYRQQIQEKLKTLIKPEQKSVLCLGDPLPALQQMCQEQNKEWVHVDTLNAQWRDLSRDQPEFELPLPAKHFDLLLVYHALEQALDPERLLLELRKYLQPEGEIYIVAYNVGHISTIINLLTEGWAYQDDGALRHSHIRYFSNESLRKLIDQVGFEFIDEIVYQLQQLPVLSRQLAQVMKNPYLSILSFIMIGRKINTFPFIDYEDDVFKSMKETKAKE
jgi:SAM-dependent methyltransferase